MNQIERDGKFTYLNLNEFRFKHPFTIELGDSVITEYYKNNLTSAVVTKLSELYNTSIGRIMLVNGGDQGLDMLIRYYKKMDAVIKVPTYGAYKTLCELYNVLYDEVLELEQKYDNKMVFICNPNNPTGEYVNIKQLAIDNPSSIFIVDETYIDFSNLESMCSYGFDNVFVIRSMSKYYGLAGVRIGCVVGDVNKMRHTFNNKNILDLSKICVLKVLENKEYYDKCAEDVRRNKDKIINVLIKMKRVFIDTPCNFICVKGVNDLVKTHDQELIFRDISSRVNCSDMYRVTIGNKNDTDKTIKFFLSLTIP